MRAAFTTEFIYDGVEDYLERRTKLCEILDVKPNSKSGNMVGQISGLTKGLDLAESDIKRWIDEMAYELSKVTIVPFKIVWLFEGGDIVIKEIVPLSKERKNEEL